MKITNRDRVQKHPWKKQIEKNTQDFIENFGALTEEELNWKPDPKTWSIAQNICHLIQLKKLNPHTVVTGKYKLDKETFHDIRSAKIVTDALNNILYISRSPIPGSKDPDLIYPSFAQVSIYAFNADELKFFANCNPGPLETIEGIELLRFLEASFSVKAFEMENKGISIDTIDQYEAFKNKIEK